MDYPVRFYERLEVYLKAIINRINKVHRNYEKDLKWNETITLLETKCQRKLKHLGLIITKIYFDKKCLKN